MKKNRAIKWFAVSSRREEAVIPSASLCLTGYRSNQVNLLGQKGLMQVENVCKSSVKCDISGKEKEKKTLLIGFFLPGFIELRYVEKSDPATKRKVIFQQHIVMSRSVLSILTFFNFG